MDDPKFETLIEAYQDHVLTSNLEYYTSQGYLYFYKNSSPVRVIIYSIEIKEELRRQGIWTGLIKHIKEQVNSIEVLACSNREIEDSLLKLDFRNRGQDLVWGKI